MALSPSRTPGTPGWNSPPGEHCTLRRATRGTATEALTTLLTFVAMDPHTGRVLALVGGFSFAESQFDRAVQARRQPGSSFKPIIYSTALDNGYTPASIIVDGPLCISQGAGMPKWCPKNYEAGSAAGPSTLRFGIEHSRNLMTVRLSNDMGMPIIVEYARRFGVYDNLMPVLSMALGAGETTLLRRVGDYGLSAWRQADKAAPNDAWIKQGSNRVGRSASGPLFGVLYVPVLDLHYGGILALVERPAIDRIFLAALLLLQDRRPMRPVFHRVQCH